MLPFRADPLGRRHSEHGRASLIRSRQSHVACRDHRPAIDRSDRHGRIVDDAIYDHRRNITLDRDTISGNAGDLPGELVVPFKVGFRRIDPDIVQNHAISPLAVNEWLAAVPAQSSLRHKPMGCFVRSCSRNGKERRA